MRTTLDRQTVTNNVINNSEVQFQLLQMARHFIGITDTHT